MKGERIQDSELAVHPRIKPYQHLLYESDSNSEEEGGNSAASKSKEKDGLSSGEEKKGEDGDEDEKESEEKETPQEPQQRKSSVPSSGTQFRNPSLEGITKLNLDVTSLLAYVSNLTNGHTNVSFKTAILTQQLEAERKNPQKPILEAIFKGSIYNLIYIFNFWQ